jgi:hypothetical protein
MEAEDPGPINSCGMVPVIADVRCAFCILKGVGRTQYSGRTHILLEKITVERVRY